MKDDTQMKKIARSRCLLLLIVFSPMAFMGLQCDPAGSQPQVLNTGALTADFSSGATFISSGARAVDQGSTISISATQDVTGLPMNEITIVVPKKSSVPYTVTLDTDPETVVAYCENVGTVCTNYFAQQGSGSCSVTIDQVYPTIQGSFSAHTVNTTVFDSVRDLYNGAFNAGF